MILNALVNYYEQLREREGLSTPGWQQVGVSAALRIDNDGTLLDIIDLRREETRGKKSIMVPRLMNVPEQVKRSSGIAPNFLCENSAYFLGWKAADNKETDKESEEKAKQKKERVFQCFDQCAELHKALLAAVEHPAAKAILNFFRCWEKEKADINPLIIKNAALLATANLVFMVGDDFLHEIQAFHTAWDDSHNKQSDGPLQRCLVTGEESPIARLHPAIKGIRGAQSSGASLVSFNEASFQSYGHDGEQGGNAPVSEYATFAYGTALNHLINDGKHVMHFGDTTVLAWSETAQPEYVDLFQATMNNDDTITDEDLSAALYQICEGKIAFFEDCQINPDTQFYVLGLSPNAARLSVRFFMQNSFGKILEHIAAHQNRLEIVRPLYIKNGQLPMWKLIQETINKKSSNKDGSPQLAGDLMRAVITGGTYPTTLYTQLQARVRAEHEFEYEKAAIVKAYLLRNLCNDGRYANIKEALTVQLNEETSYTPYVLGRLFSVLEATQEKANPGLNATIRDKYFNSACATPAVVFPRLISLAQAHLKKMDTGSKVYFDKQIQSLLAMMDQPYPKQLNLNDQGIFQLGYYHQMQKRYEKKED